MIYYSQRLLIKIFFSYNFLSRHIKRGTVNYKMMVIETIIHLRLNIFGKSKSKSNLISMKNISHQKNPVFIWIEKRSSIV